MIERGKINAILLRLRQVESAMSDPLTAGNSVKLGKARREYAFLTRLDKAARLYYHLAGEAEGCRELLLPHQQDADLRSEAEQELAVLESRIEEAEHELRLSLLPPDPDQERGAIIEIRAGTGGDEAALFAADLYRMYTRYAENRGWRAQTVSSSPSDLGGCKEIVFTLSGQDVYGALRYESGGHRVQRVPATESQGRIHTSAATVMVFPETEPEDDIELPNEELRVDIFCASGPGGQGVNTTYSAVRITHLPTGLVAQSQDERSQHRNKEKALAVLKARVLDHRRRVEESKKGTARRTLIGSGDRSQRIRTYNFPQNRLTDHRINLTIYSLDKIIAGEMDPLLDVLREKDIEQRLSEEIDQASGKQVD